MKCLDGRSIWLWTYVLVCLDFKLTCFISLWREKFAKKKQEFPQTKITSSTTIQEGACELSIYRTFARFWLHFIWLLLGLQIICWWAYKYKTKHYTNWLQDFYRKCYLTDTLTVMLAKRLTVIRTRGLEQWG